MFTFRRYTEQTFAHYSRVTIIIASDYKPEKQLTIFRYHNRSRAALRPFVFIFLVNVFSCSHGWLGHMTRQLLNLSSELINNMNAGKKRVRRYIEMAFRMRCGDTTKLLWSFVTFFAFNFSGGLRRKEEMATGGGWKQIHKVTMSTKYKSNWLKTDNDRFGTEMAIVASQRMPWKLYAMYRLWWTTIKGEREVYEREVYQRGRGARERCTGEEELYEWGRGARERCTREEKHTAWAEIRRVWHCSIR